MICICGLYQYQSSRFLPSAAPALAESDLPHQYPVFSKVSLIPRARGGHPKSNKLLKLELRTSNFRSDPLHKNRPYKKKHTHTHRTGHIPLKPARPVPLFLIFPGEEQPNARHEICQREIANNSRKEISAAAPNKYKSLGSFTKISDIDDKRCSVVH